MPDNKFSNTDRVNLTPSALSSGISGLSLNPQASLSATTQSEQTSRYNTTRDLLSQMTSLQGRLPTEADQKLQGLLKSIRQELLLLGNNLSEPSPPRQENQSVTTSSSTQQLSLRQLATLLSQQPLPDIPAGLRASTTSASSSDIIREIQTNLAKLVQQQPSAWQPDAPLGKSVINWLLQSQLSLKADYWQSLPAQDKNQLIQTGILTPTAFATTQQAQLIRKLTLQIFDLLSGQKNILPHTAPVQSGQSIVPSKTTEQASAEMPSLTTTARNGNADIFLKAFLQTITTQSANLPSQLKTLAVQLSATLQQLPPVTSSSSNTFSENKPLSPLQILLDNPLLKELSADPEVSPATMIRLMSHIKTGENQNNLPSGVENTQNNNVINSPKTLSTEQKAEIIINRWALQLIMPKLITSTTSPIQQIEIGKNAQIWLPSSTNEAQQLQPTLDILKKATLILLQQLSTDATASPQNISQQNLASAGNNISSGNSITAIQAINHNSQSANISVLQQLLEDLNALLSPGKKNTIADIPTSLRSAATELIRQFSLPLKTGQDVNEWMQFLLQPMDSDTTYSKSLQQWLFQLLTQRARTSQQVQQNDANEHDSPIIKEQLSRLDKLSEQSVELFRLPSQPTASQTSVPSHIHMPLPPRQDGEEQGQLSLQRNTKDDSERGWNIALYLEPSKLGPIRFQARIALPEISLSIVAEKISTIDLIKQTYPLLEQRFRQLGLTPQTLQVRQGKPRKETATESAVPPTTAGLSIKI